MSSSKQSPGTDAVFTAMKSLEEKGFAVNWEAVPAAEDVLQFDYDDEVEHACIPERVKPYFFELMDILSQRFGGKPVTYACFLSKSYTHYARSFVSPGDAPHHRAGRVASGVRIRPKA